jgi:hypothetical protein
MIITVIYIILAAWALSATIVAYCYWAELREGKSRLSRSPICRQVLNERIMQINGGHDQTLSSNQRLLVAIANTAVVGGWSKILCQAEDLLGGELIVSTYGSRERLLLTAAALLVAEIERLQMVGEYAS